MDGQHVRDILADLGWSQVELAARLDISPSTVMEWCVNRRTITGPARAYLEQTMRMVGLARSILDSFAPAGRKANDRIDTLARLIDDDPAPPTPD